MILKSENGFRLLGLAVEFEHKTTEAEDKVTRIAFTAQVQAYRRLAISRAQQLGVKAPDFPSEN